MKTDMILVSIDDHVVEPPDMFERHVPANFKDEAPTSSPTTRASSSGLSGQAAGRQRAQRVVSWPKEEWGLDPAGFAEMRPAPTTSTSASAT